MGYNITAIPPGKRAYPFHSDLVIALNGYHARRK